MNSRLAICSLIDSLNIVGVVFVSLVHQNCLKEDCIVAVVVLRKSNEKDDVSKPSR